MDNYFVLNNGVKIPAIGFGTVGLKGKEGIDVILSAISAGYRMIDTARMYGNEAEVGEAIKKCGLSRSDLFITTKLNEPCNSYSKAKAAIEDSLKNLGLDYVDLLLIHEPYPEAVEMYRALEEAYKDGKARAIGVSSFNERKLKSILENCSVIPAVNQIESHVYYPELELKEYLKLKNIQTEAWAPFGGGNIKVSEEPVLVKIGEKYGKTANQVALKFLIQNEIAAIPKSRNPERMKQNLEIFDFNLTEEEMAEIKTLDRKETLYDWMKDWE